MDARPTRATLVRIAAGSVLAGLLLWAALAGGRWGVSSVERCLKEGSIGGLSEAKAREFERFCAWVAEGAGIQTPVRVDRMPAKGVLNCYTTTPRAVPITRCARGNAVYDSARDMIFIDQDLVLRNNAHDKQKPSILVNSFAPGEWSAVHAYLAFLLLHEMGHRQLHAERGGFFDAGGASEGARSDPGERLELEADRFALDRLVALYRLDLERGGRWIGTGHREPAGLLDEPLADDERVWSDLLGLPLEILPQQLEDDDPYSPLHSDAVHPTMVVRLGRLLDVAATRKLTGEGLRETLALAREQLHRMRTMIGRPVCELTSAGGIRAVGLGRKHLLVGFEGGDLTRIPLSSILESPSPSGWLHKYPTDRAPRIPAPPGLSPLVALWESSDEARLMALGEQGDLAVWSAGRWTKSGSLAAPAGTVRQVYPGPIHTGPRAVYVITRPGEHDFQRFASDRSLHVVIDGRPGPSRTFAALERDVLPRSNLTKCRLEVGTVLSTGLEVLVFDAHEAGIAFQNLYGIATLNKVDLSLVEIRRVSLPDRLDRPDAVLAFETPSGPPRLFSVGLDVEPEALSWGVWEIPDRSPPVQITTASFLTDLIGDGPGLGPLRRGYDPHLQSVHPLPGDRFLVSYFGDSVFLVDPADRSREVIFHPGGGPMAVNDEWAAILPVVVPIDHPTASSQRCYLVRLH